MIVTYEAGEGLAYIFLTNHPTKRGGVARSVPVGDDVVLDFSHDGALIGVELLRKYRLHPDLLAQAIPPGLAVIPANLKETIAWAITDCRRDGVRDAEDYADRIVTAISRQVPTLTSPTLPPKEDKRTPSDDFLRPLHAAAQSSYDELLGLSTAVPDTLRPDTALALGIAIGALRTLKAMAGRDLDDASHQET